MWAKNIMAARGKEEHGKSSLFLRYNNNNNNNNNNDNAKLDKCVMIYRLTINHYFHFFSTHEDQ